MGSGSGSRDPYAGLLGQPVSIILRSGALYAGELRQVTNSFVRLRLDGDGETCILRRDAIDVIRTARADSPQARDVYPHGNTGVGTVRT